MNHFPPEAHSGRMTNPGRRKLKGASGKRQARPSGCGVERIKGRSSFSQEAVALGDMGGREAGPALSGHCLYCLKGEGISRMFSDLESGRL